MDRTQLSPFLGITIRSILQDQSATGRREMLHRPFHGLILKLEGTTEYHHNGAVTLLSGGEVLYSPTGVAETCLTSTAQRSSSLEGPRAMISVTAL